MKEKIIEILGKIGRPKDLNDIDSPAFWLDDAADEIIALVEFNALHEGIIRDRVDAEVEKRIAERMPTDLDIVIKATEWVKEEPARGYCRFGFVEGIEWLRSRLTNTEGGGE